MANSRTSVDGRHEEQEGQHGTFPQAGLGLERLIRMLARFRDLMSHLDTLNDIVSPGVLRFTT